MKSVYLQNDDLRLPPRVRQRLTVSDAQSQANAQAVNERIGPERLAEFSKRLGAIVYNCDPLWIRLRALYALVDEHMSYVQGNTACTKGCSHCCHIAVALLRPEAEMLGSDLGVKPKAISGIPHFDDFDWGYHNPCSFLINNECSIYANRPLECRLLFAMDSLSTLCELDPPYQHSTPYLSTLQYQHAYVAICNSTRVGDIREYFPRNESLQMCSKR